MEKKYSDYMENQKEQNEIVVRVLENTGFFERPESDLKDIFALKTSGKEAFLLGCYGSFLGRAYYFYDEKQLLSPPSEEDILALPPVPLKSLWIDDIPSAYSPLPALCLLRRDKQLLDKVLQKDKYIVFRNSGWWIDFLFRTPWPRIVTPSEQRRYEYYYREGIVNLRKEVVKKGIDPLNVLVIDGAVDKRTEGFLTPYLIGIKLREEKYLVSNRSLGKAGGDLFAYRAKDFGSGTFMVGLVTGIEEIREGESEPLACVIEDEAQTRITDSDHGIAQVKGYVAESSGYFGKGFVVAPLADEYQIKEAEKQGVGILSFDEKGELIFRDCKGEPSSQQLEITEEIKNVACLARECFNFLRQKF